VRPRFGPATNTTQTPPTLSVEIVTDRTALPPLAGGWDALADACGRPRSAAAWAAAWACRAAPDAALRVAVVRDGARIVGIAPFALVTQRGVIRRLEPLAGPVSGGTDVLAVPGREEEVARAACPALAAVTPTADLLRLEDVPVESPWPRLLARHWPGGRPGYLRCEHVEPEPVVSLVEPDFDAWLAGKSSNFRQQLRRARRKLEQRGGVVRRAATHEEVQAGLAAFVRLHHSRWEDRGGTGILTPAVEAMLSDACPAMVERDRLDLWSVEVDGRAVGSQIWLRGGGSTTMWLSGSDDDYADVRPAVLIIAAAIEDAFARGLRRATLGPGGQPYKQRFSDRDDEVRLWALALPGPRLAVGLGVVGARATRRVAGSRLGEERKAQLKQVAARITGHP
jgi:CelD/BcsL family acetyltransferase involved in cellulose biosynthesis